MKKFCRYFLVVLAVSLSSLGLSACSQSGAPKATDAQLNFQEGKDYTIVPSSNEITPPPTPNSTIHVIEFFSYGCPFCYRFEPYLRAWLATKPKDVEFERIPVVFEPGWDILARAYYTAKDLGVASKLTPALFAAVQVQGEDLSNINTLEQIFVSNGVSKADFESTYNFSPGIDAQLMRGDNLMQTYGVYEVPSLVVDGKYVTSVRMTNGDDKRLIQVLDYLVQQARQNGEE